ncbi:putative receptor-like protein kinase At3g47110 [Rhododendron vialii]|uniref:putative receptor-like protein kinase At3g47110 n=1 Tax=Rhododendron vialii TaxID=182163 RepID=UPI00265E6CB5|nr:putative receptor-like protein kinase At3g47110 [Rhododendron vialii]
MDQSSVGGEPVVEVASGGGSCRWYWVSPVVVLLQSSALLLSLSLTLRWFSDLCGVPSDLVGGGSGRITLARLDFGVGGIRAGAWPWSLGSTSFQPWVLLGDLKRPKSDGLIVVSLSLYSDGFAVSATWHFNEITTAVPMSNETDRQALLAIKDLVQGDAFPVFRSWNHSIHFCKWEGVTCGRKHQRVTILDLSSRGLVGSLSPHAGNLTFLRTIDLGNNSFHGTIPNEIGRLFRLQHVILGNNSFEGKLPTNITCSSNIKEINPNNNHLGGELPVGLYDMLSLSFVSLTSNQLHGTLAPDFDLALPNLQVFFIGGNHFFGPIPSSIGNSSRLLRFHITDNAINGPTPKSLGNLNDLEIFTADTNSLGTNSGNELHNIMNTLSNCSNLRELRLTANNFSGLLPHSIANLSKFLSYLTLGDNYISGSIPVGIENILNLQLFSVVHNMLSGSIPESIENKLEERIPDSLGNCKRLQVIDLSSNKLTGTIPGQIFELSSLSIGLFLDHNQ